MKLKDLVGKTIVKASIRGIKGYDDRCFLDLTFSDKTGATIVGGHGGYTGHSRDEYQDFVELQSLGYKYPM